MKVTMSIADGSKTHALCFDTREASHLNRFAVLALLRSLVKKLMELGALTKDDAVAVLK